MTAKFEVGNQVFIRQSSGTISYETIYEITKMLPACGCLIRPIGKVNGKPYAEQRFDTSLLKHAITDEMLAAFSFGPLRAKR